MNGIVKKRQKHFTAARFLLKCGHEALEYTSYYRLRGRRKDSLIDYVMRAGLLCPKCNIRVEAAKFLGTRSYESSQVKKYWAEAGLSKR